MTEEIITTEITAKQRLISNLTAAIGIILCGLFLLLCGVGAIGVDIVGAIAPAILIAFGAILLINALVQTNTVSLYLSVLFFVCALTSCLANFAGSLNYGKLYPFYIAAPAIASLFTMLMSRNFVSHTKVIVVFGVPSFFFFMLSFGVWAWYITLPAVLTYVGLLALYVALSVRAKPEE